MNTGRACASSAQELRKDSERRESEVDWDGQEEIDECPRLLLRKR
jgi:hypothetical protein